MLDTTGATGDLLATPSYVCNSISTRSTAEPRGANCSLGGQRLDVGVDSNGDGNLSDIEISSTVFVCDAPHYTHVAVGRWHACAVVNDGTVTCWGNGFGGDLLERPNYDVRIQIDNIDNAVAVTSGVDFSCFLLSDHTARCVGDNTNGQLGTTADFGFAQQRDEPIAWEVVGPDGTERLENISALVAGANHCCAVVGDRAYCWGFNGHGTLGRGEAAGYDDSPIPAPVVGVDGIGLLTGVSAVSAGAGFSCAVVADGEVRCWGGHRFGELGAFIVSADTPEPSLWLSIMPTPIVVRGADGAERLTGVSAISTGENHSCVIVDGGVLCWGYNSHGQLGMAPELYGLPFAGFETSPGVALRGVKAIATGTYDTCILAEGFESALCWGDAYGLDDENGHTVPGSYSQVPGTSGLQALTQGEDPVCGIHRDGSALCWVDELVRRFRL
jgi:hypothetical protein